MTTRIVIAVLATLLLAVDHAGAQSASAMPIFVEPPEPEFIAALLFEPRYRSIDGTPGAAPDGFGMMIHFDHDSTRIVAASLPLLDSVGEMLKLEQTSKEALIIEGHADASGSEAYNEDLSLRRAQALAKYLVGSFGVDENRLVVIGAGESRPHDAQDPYAAVNRRVVFRPARSIVVH